MTTSIDPGYYTNIFEVKVEPIDIPIMAIDRGKYPDLRNLREEIKESGKDAFVYAPERCKSIYGFGKDMQWLVSKGFNQKNINLHNEPRLTGYMILEGFIKKVQGLGFLPLFSKDKGRCRLFNWNKFKTTSDNNVKIFLGYDIKVIFLKDQIENSLVFGIILDAIYSLKDSNDNPLNFHEITTKFGTSTLREIRQIQRDLIPTGINKEISRHRLVEDILPFIEKTSEIDLPCGIKTQITLNPSRIILGEEDETVW